MWFSCSPVKRSPIASPEQAFKRLTISLEKSTVFPKCNYEDVTKSSNYNNENPWETLDAATHRLLDFDSKVAEDHHVKSFDLSNDKNQLSNTKKIRRIKSSIRLWKKSPETNRMKLWKTGKVGLRKSKKISQKKTKQKKKRQIRVPNSIFFSTVAWKVMQCEWWCQALNWHEM